MLINPEDDALILDKDALGAPFTEIIPCLDPDLAESDKINEEVMGKRVFNNHPSIEIIVSEDCTTDWLALNAPDYYGFMPSQEVIGKVMKLMQTIKNPNDVIWKGFEVILDEGGNFKHAVVKGPKKPESASKEPEEIEEV